VILSKSSLLAYSLNDNSQFKFLHWLGLKHLEFSGLQMKSIFKSLLLLIALSAVPVFAQSDFEATKARAEAGDAV
jgi:hypothetical protein